MQFARKSIGGANGQAALALVVGLMQVLKEQGVLSDAQLTEAVIKAVKLSPHKNNERDREVRDMLAALKLSGV